MSAVRGHNRTEEVASLVRPAASVMTDQQRRNAREARRARMSVHHTPMPAAAKARALDAMCRHLSAVHGGVRFAIVPRDDESVDRPATRRSRQDGDVMDRAA